MKRSIVFGVVVSGLLFAACAGNTGADENTTDVDLTTEENESGKQVAFDEMMYDPAPVNDVDRRDQPKYVATNPSVYEQPYAAKADELEESNLFLKEATSAAIVGTLMADLAIRHSDDRDVEALANSVKKDYAIANAKLHRIALRENWIIPVGLTPEDQQKVYDLQHQSAADYPDVYIDRMISEHEKNIAKLDRYCAKHDDAVADWSEQQINTLRKHIVRAEQVMDQLVSN